MLKITKNQTKSIRMMFNWPLRLNNSLSGAPTVGPMLDVSLPQLGIDRITAKVDTGAFSGSLHAQDIQESKEDGKRQLRFRPYGSVHGVVTVDKYHRRTVKSSNGQRSDRFAFNTAVVVEGKTYPITITLSDRSAMKYQMLIGRNFLETHGFIVDVSKNNL
jgi:hypothetical protein